MQLEGAIGAAEAAEERLDATLQASRTDRRRVNRGQLPTHLPRIEKPQPQRLARKAGEPLHGRVWLRGAKPTMCSPVRLAGIAALNPPYRQFTRPTRAAPGF